MKRFCRAFLLSFIAMCVLSTPVSAVETIPTGVHILSIEELPQAAALTSPSEQDSRWSYVTIPFTLADLEKQTEWQTFFTTAREEKIIPIVRLATRFENGAWAIPTKKNVYDQIQFLSRLEWPTTQRHIIVYNEVNHAKEWGGTIDPNEYARVFRFAAEWAHTEAKNYVVLPAALDLAAPNGSQTMEAFAYLEKLHAADSTALALADAWNSHSYPNPGFSAAPTRTGKNSLRGFEHELAFIKNKTGKELQVYITETGWDVSPQLSRWLKNYYEYALQHIWSDHRVVAVTPFILRGAPGPFAGFSFLDEAGKPTPQYVAYKQAIEKQFAVPHVLSATFDTIE